MNDIKKVILQMADGVEELVEGVILPEVFEAMAQDLRKGVN